jgi:hypothetical protein
MLREIKVYILSLAIIGAIIGLWLMSYPLHCLSFVAPLIALVFISFSFIEIKIVNKNCFNRCYLKEGTLLFRLFASKILLMLFYTLLALIFTLSLFIEMIFYSTALKLYLIFHILLMLMIYLLIKRRITKLVNIPSILAREWSIMLGLVIVMGAFIYITLHSYTPVFVQDSLEATIIHASNMVGSECRIVDDVIRLKAEFNGAFWWVIENTADRIEHKMTRWGIWLGFILMNALALLGVNRLIVTVIDLVDRVLRTKA